MPVESNFLGNDACNSSTPCAAGQGDCDNDDDCLGGLVCGHRALGDAMPPGVVASSDNHTAWQTDFCYNPAAVGGQHCSKSSVGVLASFATAGNLSACEAFCTKDERCQACSFHYVGPRFVSPPPSTALCTESGVKLGAVSKEICTNTRDTCEVYIKRGSENGVSGINTCHKYCAAYGLTCKAEYDDDDSCKRTSKYPSCDSAAPSSDHICECGPAAPGTTTADIVHQWVWNAIPHCGVVTPMAPEPVCMNVANTVWAMCGAKQFKHWGLGAEGAATAVRNCQFAVRTNRDGWGERCPRHGGINISQTIPYLSIKRLGRAEQRRGCVSIVTGAEDNDGGVLRVLIDTGDGLRDVAGITAGMPLNRNVGKCWSQAHTGKFLGSGHPAGTLQMHRSIVYNWLRKTCQCSGV